MDFPGCLLVVSHDRFFMDKIVDHLFVFRGEAVVEDFPGSYSDFRQSEEQKDLAQSTQKKQRTTEQAPTGWREKTPGGKLSYSEQREYQKLESDILQLEQQRDEIQTRFSDNDLSGEVIDRLSVELNDLQARLAQKTERWFELSEKLES